MKHSKKSIVFPMLIAIVLTGCNSGGDKQDNSNLMAQTVLPLLDDQCAYGGLLVTSGSDQDGDGQLHSSEVSHAETKCNAADSQILDAELKSLITQQSLTGDPTAGRALPNISEPLSHLGMLLFFSKGLGGDQDAACVSCHHPFLGGGDALSLPVGVAAEFPDLLGPGRSHLSGAEGFDGGPTVPRNAPTTFNIALWDQVLFHDGRVESLTKTPGANGTEGQIRTPDSPFGLADANAIGTLTAAQARFPMTSPEEMRGFDFEAGQANAEVRSHLAARFAGVLNELPENRWLDAFRVGFRQPTGSAEELITFDNIIKAIAAYENSQVFIDTPFKRYVDGNTNALSGEAKLGALLFFGEAGCSNCHSGDFFTDEDFHVIAMPQIGRGKGDGKNSDNDFGRFRETGLAEDRFAFRTPSLINVTVTGPWSHAGAYHDLIDVIRHHLNPRLAVENYDLTQLEPGTQTNNLFVNTMEAVEQLENLRAQGQSRLQEVNLTDEQIGWLETFLQALTDICVADRDCLQRWVPGEGDANPDGLRIEAVDGTGEPL
jgi:cytochrome c peroxidase